MLDLQAFQNGRLLLGRSDFSKGVWSDSDCGLEHSFAAPPLHEKMK
jgi:hypothetical protein